MNKNLILNFILLIIIFLIKNIDCDVILKWDKIKKILDNSTITKIKLNKDVQIKTTGNQLHINTYSDHVLLKTPNSKLLLTDFKSIILTIFNKNQTNEPKDDTTTTTEKPNDEKDKLKDKLLIPDSLKLDQWLNFKGLKMNTEFYLFNITNPNEIKNGEKPVLNEVGPFNYLKLKRYENLGWQNDENEILVNLYKNYTYDGKLDLNAEITTINVPLIFLYNTIGNTKLNEILRRAILIVLEPYSLFIKQKIGDLLFNGYKDKLLKNIKSVLAKLKQIGVKTNIDRILTEDNYFSFMGKKNNTNFGTWTINTGKSNFTKIGQINQIDGNSTNECWSGECAILNGTDGVINVVNINHTHSIDIFVPEHYRVIKLNRIRYKENKKIKEYIWSKNTFANSKFYEPNKCYLNEKNKDDLDDYSGILKACHLFNSPIITSNPHFLFGDLYITNQVKGLKAQESKHDSYMAYSTSTGELLYGKSSVQINFDTKYVSNYHKLKIFVMPLFWLSDGYSKK